MKEERLKKLEWISLEVLPAIIFETIGREAELEFQLITITWVKISTDLSYMDVFVSAIKNPEKLAKFLAWYNYEIQKKFNKSVNIRRLPKIRFRSDNSWETSQNINSIVKDISKELEKNDKKILQKNLKDNLNEKLNKK